MPLSDFWRNEENLSESAEETKTRITFEIEQIDRLLQTYADLLKRVRQHQPDLVEVTAVASVLHSFYNGLENIFTDIRTPSFWNGINWRIWSSLCRKCGRRLKRLWTIS